MGMWSMVRIHAETENKEQMKLSRALDVHDYGWGKETGMNPNILDWEESLKSFDAEEVIQQMMDILADQGKAYIIVNCEEDIPECTTYYYLGDGVKQVHFTSEETQKTTKKKSSTL